MKEVVERELRNRWEVIMDTGDERPLIYSADFAWKIGLLTDQERELWILRAEKCPGHGDGGDGRKWCAYCGDLHLGGCDLDLAPSKETLRFESVDPATLTRDQLVRPVLNLEAE